LFKRKDEILQTYYKYKKSIHLYLVFHDCGKPFCKTIDDTKVHFYDHENLSYLIFKSVFNNKIASYLIKHDMDLHKSRTNNVQELKNLFLLDILCLSYVAEIYANRELFGGESSENFKIKKKQMESKIKKIFS
jgi:CRISPR/Cas system-associated endonuclease Cas3-HD